MNEESSSQKEDDPFPILINNLSLELKPWITEAEKRTFCLGAGERIVPIACSIMNIGFAKVLYAANELGADVEESKPFILFAPDCTCTFNRLRTERGFSYGALIQGDFSGLISTSNSMPNACGYTLAEITLDKTDESLINHLKQKQKEIGKDYLQQLGKGNHFSAVYYVKDAITGEDTMKRHINVHSSGKLGAKYLYNLDWLGEYEGYYKIETPHGSIELLEGDAKKIYLDSYNEGDKINTEYRKQVLTEILGEGTFEILDEITHQGLSEDGRFHRLGVQVHDGNIPIAFNSEEGLILAKTKPNLSEDFLENWEYKSRVDELGYKKELTSIDFTPHGGGYEIRYPVTKFILNLDKNGIKNFELTVKEKNDKEKRMKATFLREIKEYVSFRRKLPLMREVFRADLVEHIFDLEPLMQICPLVSVVGGTL